MVKYRPNLGSPHWELKTQQDFDTVEEMLAYVAKRTTAYKRYVNCDQLVTPDDLVMKPDSDLIIGWKNFYHIVLEDHVVGYCGE